MFSCISQSQIRGQKHSSCCSLPLAHRFKHFFLHPQHPKMFKKHSCAGMKLILCLGWAGLGTEAKREDVLLKNTIELNEPIVPYVRSLLASTFLHPGAQHVSHAFRSRYRHSDFSRQPALSFHARLIWLAACPRSGDRQLHLQELARPCVPVGQLLPTGWPRAEQHGDYHWGTCIQENGCSFPASCGPHRLEKIQVSPQPAGQA